MQRLIRRWGTVFCGSVVGGLVLLLLLGGDVGRDFGAAHLAMLALCALAAVLRYLYPPQAALPIIEQTADADKVVLPLAALAVASAALSADAALVFPFVLIVVVYAAASLPRVALGAAVGYAAAAEIARFIGAGAWAGDLPEVGAHLLFIAAFAAGGALLLRGEIAAARKQAQDNFASEQEALEAEARALGLAGESAEPNVDLQSRLAALRASIGEVLALARKSAGAHSAVLMTRANDGDAFCVAGADTPEQELLTQEPVPASHGLLAVLTRVERSGAEREPVVRISPLEGRAGGMPYYTHTPARIKSMMGLAVRRGPSIVALLLFDRTAGPAFDDAAAEQARQVADLIASMLETERALHITEQRSGTLGHLIEANRTLSEAFSAEEIHSAVLSAAERLTPLRFAALVVPDTAGRPRIVHALGDGAEGVVGRRLEDGTTLAAMVLKTPTPVPPSRTWHPAHGSLLGGDLGPRLREGDPVLAVPLHAHKAVAGALVLVGHAPLDDEHVELLRLLASQAGIAVQHAAAMAELQSRASTDSLTALDNRETSMNKLDQTLARCGRAKQQSVVMLLDIDHFKKVNDTHGHQAGDMVLRQISRTLEESKRMNDSVGRFGGEEFIIILEDTGEAGARLVGERIRKRIAASTFPSQQGPFRVTASLGFAVCPRDGERVKELLSRADKALYAAKDAGRDQVRDYRDPINGPTVAAVANG